MNFTKRNIMREEFNMKNLGILHLAVPKPGKQYEPSVYDDGTFIFTIFQEEW